ncbi:MAG: phosphate ABC transporter permease PstA [Candidatus Eisenbacteria bacterium]|nr:phosphate ABC transporter permease PstA [Candidatus Eisenbacteria bacterium]
MQLGTRRLLDRAFSGLGFISIGLMAASLLVILTPIFVRGFGAFVFQGTIEFRRMQLERFERGDRDEIEAELTTARRARQPVYEMLDAFDTEMGEMGFLERREYEGPREELEDALRELLGPRPEDPVPVMARDQYGATRWDRAREKIDLVLYRTEYDYSDRTRMGVPVSVPRVEDFRGTALEALFDYVELHATEMLRPRWTLYLRFLTDHSIDAHFFGGIWPEVLGTLYLTLGAMIFALPMGVVSAIYLVEYAGEGRLISLLRTFISTLAGVPSIVFGLFGLAFFINTLKITESKSLLAGSLTLATLVLPTVIRASEEAIRSVPTTYREAALSLGASKWRAIVTVILPASLPGILTGVVISMGRAAGETAPIIFTAAVSVGKALDFAKVKFWETLSEATPALPWNIYNLATEHEAVDEIRHVQFGMVFTLVMLVLILNATAIFLRARISKKLRG